MILCHLCLLRVVEDFVEHHSAEARGTRSKAKQAKSSANHVLCIHVHRFSWPRSCSSRLGIMVKSFKESSGHCPQPDFITKRLRTSTEAIEQRVARDHVRPRSKITVNGLTSAENASKMAETRQNQLKIDVDTSRKAELSTAAATCRW